METETKTETEIEFRRCSTIGFEHMGRGHETSNTGSLWKLGEKKVIDSPLQPPGIMKPC